MFDPVTIGIAFTAAQQSVGYIKKAIALGKDINSLHVQFAKFFQHSDTVHTANIQALNNKNPLTDGQIRALSIQIAMQSKALRDAEKQLKEMLIYSGNKDVWDEMMKERVRMYKERAAQESKELQAKAKKRQGLIDNLLIFSSSVATVIPTITLIFNTLVKYAPK